MCVCVCVCVYTHIMEYYSVVKKKRTKFCHSNMDRPGSNINQTEKKQYCMISLIWGFPGGSDGKESTCNAGDLASIPGLGRSLGREDPLEEGMATHSSILAWRIPVDKGSWRATLHSVAKSQTRLSD